VREHVVIRREEYVAGTRERPEVGVFTCTHSTRHPVPWGQVSPGETVWMKWASGPIVARAVVQGFRQIEACTAATLRAAVAGTGLHGRDAYWSGLSRHFAAVVVYLDREEWLDEPFVPARRSRGESWIVLDEARAFSWLAGTRAPVVNGTPTRAGVRRTRTISASLRFQVLRRDGFKCTYCGRSTPEVRLQVDHVVAWSAGGASSLDNLRASCVECNLGKGAHSLGNS
jgi:hypothetical protein